MSRRSTSRPSSNRSRQATGLALEALSCFLEPGGHLAAHRLPLALREARLHSGLPHSRIRRLVRGFTDADLT